MSWLSQVQKAADQMPPWFVEVVNHPMFLSLDRATDRSWRIVTREEMEFAGTSIREVFQNFTDHYARP